MRAQALAHVLGLVVDRRVESEFIDEVAAFGCAAGDTDRAAALDLRDLADGRADGPGSAGDNDGVAGLGLADVEEAEIGGHAGHAERVEKNGQRRDFGIDLGELRAGKRRIFLSPERAADVVVHGEAGMLRGGHAADAAGAHHFADADRGDVGLAFVHPAAHGRIERKVKHLGENLAVARLRHRRFGELPIAALRQADRARCQPDLMVLGVGHDVLNLLRQAS
jgi:hypothetical protein